MTILIVEESLLIGRRIHNLLAETGHIDTIYQSVEHKKAAAFFQNIQPQVVVLDMCLPGSLTIELLASPGGKVSSNRLASLLKWYIFSVAYSIPPSRLTNSISSSTLSLL